MLTITQTYCGDHFTVYANIESPETNMLYVNYTSI